MKMLLRGEVLPVPADADVPRSLRVRLRAANFADETRFVEGVPLDEPLAPPRVLFDQTVPIESAARLSAALRGAAETIARYVGAFEAAGGRSL